MVNLEPGLLNEVEKILEQLSREGCMAAASLQMEYVDSEGDFVAICQGPEPTRSLGPASEPTRARLRSPRLVTFDH